jgi:hypothetical protein
MKIYFLTMTYFRVSKRDSTCYVGLTKFIIMYQNVFLAELITLVLLT